MPEIDSQSPTIRSQTLGGGWRPAFVVFVTTALLTAGAAALANSGRWEQDDERSKREAFRGRLADLVEAVQDHYYVGTAPVVEGEEEAEPVELEPVQGAIAGMLGTLDPHTNFLSARSYKSMRESQDGSFHGLGIIISVRKDHLGEQRLTVISPIQGTPAWRLGVRSGDIIAAIEGESTEGSSLDQAVSKLRGKKGTKVRITIDRGDESFDLDIERAAIPTESVPHAYMIREDTGFIRIKDFTRTTKQELDEAIERLTAEGMTQVIVDVRDNPGGLLDAAIDVAGSFLDEGDLVVETRGRVRGSNDKRVAPKGSPTLNRDMPLVVLVNRGAASASEILAGAVQDHDRGLVVGTTSWGKGLVQSVYSLSADAGLALTTARYYTPSGRQIQRDYRSSFYDYYFPPVDSHPEGASHLTDGGRTVHSGGGIEPDLTVEGRQTHKLVSSMIQKSIFFRFAQAYKEEGRTFTKERGLVEEDMKFFRSFIEKENLEYDEEDWTTALPELRVQVQYELASLFVEWKEGFRVLNSADPQVQAALELLPHAERPLILARSQKGEVLEWVKDEDGLSDGMVRIAEMEPVQPPISNE